VFLVFVIDSVGAVSSNLGDSYRPGETIIAELSGSILNEITASQIKLKRINVEIAIDYGIKKLEDRYFLWLIAPTAEENYTLVIENILTNSGGVVQNVDYEKSFSVSGSLADFSVRPAAIFASEDFEIEAKLNGDADKVISVDFPSARDVVLKPGLNRIDFSVSEVAETQLVFISVGEYSVPVYVVGQDSDEIEDEQNDGVIVIEDESNGVNEVEIANASEESFTFSSSVIKVTLLKEEVSEIIMFEINNTGTNEISPKFNYNTQVLEISPNSGIVILPGENAKFELKIKDSRDGFREAVVASSGNFSDYFLVVLNLTSDIQEASTEFFGEEEGSVFYSCSELRGKICGAEEVCSVDTIDSSEGTCCIGSCEMSSGGSSSIIGYALAILVLIILFFAYKKYRKTKGVSK